MLTTVKVPCTAEFFESFFDPPVDPRLQTADYGSKSWFSDFVDRISFGDYSKGLSNDMPYYITRFVIALLSIIPLLTCAVVSFGKKVGANP